MSASKAVLVAFDNERHRLMNAFVCCCRNSRLISAYKIGFTAELKHTNKWAAKNVDDNVKVDQDTCQNIICCCFTFEIFC